MKNGFIVQLIHKRVWITGGNKNPKRFCQNKSDICWSAGIHQFPWKTPSGGIHCHRSPANPNPNTAKATSTTLLPQAYTLHKHQNSLLSQGQLHKWSNVGPVQAKYCPNLKKTFLKWTILDLMMAIKCYFELDRCIWCNTITIPLPSHLNRPLKKAACSSVECLAQPFPAQIEIKEDDFEIAPSGNTGITWNSQFGSN